ncbi:MAG: DUF547 domain-containing protein [Deltaproteobacteria bacterium]|jgi:ribosomal protein L27|nr:DUF547 domain-containing protein [Deltaproteobacteria bacterium]
MNKHAITIISLIFLLIGIQPPAVGAGFDHSLFDQVLKSYVDDQGRVDYNGIAKDQAFKTYMEALKSAPVDSMSRDEQLAFWINAYNAVTIDKVIKWKPQKSVRETFVPGVWTGTKFFTTREHTVAGKSLSQDDIEHEILRKQLKEPRIHFAIVCASSSCPPLARFAYTGENVQVKLEEETRNYINSQRGTRFDPAENILYLSKLFDWFAGDFEYASGSVLDFLKPYLDEQGRAFLDRQPALNYIHYDWALNAQEPIK